MVEEFLQELGQDIAKLLLVTLPIAFLKSRYDKRQTKFKRKLSALIGKGGTMNECEFPLTSGFIGIGTDPNRCAIVYPEGTTDIAPLHCQIMPKDDGWRIVSFGGSNTWINGQVLNVGQDYPLNEGDILCLGNANNIFMVCGIDYSSRKDETIIDKFFRSDGRLNRKPYLLRILAVSLVTYSLYALIAMVEKQSAGPLFLLIYVISSIICYKLSVRRMHDCGDPGFNAWGAAIMPAFFCMIMGIKKGTTGANRFGPDPLE